MEHDSSFNNQKRKEVTAGTVMKKAIKRLNTDKDENNKKIYDVHKEINTIQKAIRRRKQKHKHHRELSLRANEFNNLKTEKSNKMEALRQIISHIEEVKNEVKHKIEELKKKNKNIPQENPFDFIEYFDKRKEDNEIYLGLFLELADENKILYNQTPKNTSREDMEKLRTGLLTNGYFSLGDDGDIDINRFFKNSNQLANFIDKLLDK